MHKNYPAHLNRRDVGRTEEINRLVKTANGKEGHTHGLVTMRQE